MSEHEPFDFGMHMPDGSWISNPQCRRCFAPWPCEASTLIAERDALRTSLATWNLADATELKLGTIYEQHAAELAALERHLAAERTVREAADRFIHATDAYLLAVRGENLKAIPDAFAVLQARENELRAAVTDYRRAAAAAGEGGHV